MKKILIAGGGASGMAAAISAASSGASVVLLEAKEQTGKKLLRTGSGRCNFTNAKMDPDCYYGDRAFLRGFLERFSTADCLAFFRGLGLLFKERDGYYYPYSNSAASVLSVLNTRMHELGVDIRVNTAVHSVSVLPDGCFSVKCGGNELTGDALIVASGSSAGSEYDSGGFMDLIPEDYGIRFRPFLPALTMLYGNEGCERVWEGVRCRASVTYAGRTEKGELQLLSRGISGIPVFQLSGPAVRALENREEVSFDIDFFPDYTEDELKRQLLPGRKLEDGLRGWLPRKLIPVILRRAGLFGDRRTESLKENELEVLLRTMKHFSYRVTGHGDFRDAQTVSGGADPAELSRDFESLRIPGLYFTGESVDIDGICGGYNLHFAFGSGLLAGASAAEKQF